MDIEKTATIKEIVEYNLDKLPEDEYIKLNLKDIIYVFQTLTEYMRFFHQPENYKKLEDIKAFLGTIDSGGAFEVLNTAIYKKMYKIKFPPEIEKMFDDGIFDHPLYPEYYKENNVE